MNNYPNPCDSCTKTSCGLGGYCLNWKIRYLFKQKRINAYAARHSGKYKVKQGTTFCYEHPDIIRRYLLKGPCDRCHAADVCDTPCAAYWNWWDSRMDWFKGGLRNDLR